MTVNDASLGESGSKLSKVAATSLLMGVTRASSEAYREVVFSVHISLLTVLAYLHSAVAVYLHVHLPVLLVEVVHVIVKAEQTVIDTHINEWLYSMYVQGGFPIKYTKRASRFAPSI